MDGQVPEALGFQGWLKAKSQAFQDKLLGTQKAALWREGKITLQDLVDPKSGAVMSIKELEASIAARELAVLGPRPAKAVREQLETEIADAEVRAADIKGRWEDVANQADAAIAKNDTALAEKLGDVWTDLNTQLEEVRIEQHKLKNDFLTHFELPLSERGKLEYNFHNKQAEKEFSAKTQQSSSFVQRFVNPKYLPDKTLTVRFGPIGQNRAFYSQDAIWMHEQSEPSIYTHEIMHYLEETNPDLTKKLVSFRESRTRGETPKKMAELDPEHGYPPNEITLENKWREWGGSHYTGKLYADDKYTEILSMGMQRLHQDPVSFARDDPDFFDFTLDTIRGL
jgi:hypothetical protein